MGEPGRNPDLASAGEAPWLRHAAPQDEEFLLAVFAASRAPEYSLAGLNGARLDKLLRMQFRAREQSYAARFPGSHPAIVMAGGKQVGCVRLARSTHEYRLVNIEILPEFQNRRIGSAVAREFLEEARRTGKPLRLSVAKSNMRSVRFYRRLGLTICGDDGVYLEMEMAP